MSEQASSDSSMNLQAQQLGTDLLAALSRNIIPLRGSETDIVQNACEATAAQLVQLTEADAPAGTSPADILSIAASADALATAAMSLIRTGEPSRHAAGAGLLYLATQLADFTGDARRRIFNEALQVFGLPPELAEVWAQDGVHPPEEEPWRDMVWAQNVNMRGLCLLEQLSPGAAAELAYSPFRVTHFGRWRPVDLKRQQELYHQMLAAISSGVPLDPDSYILAELGDDDHNNSTYSDDSNGYYGSTSYRLSHLQRIGQLIAAEFGSIDDIVYTAAFLALAHGITRAELLNQSRDFIPVLLVGAHGAPDRIGPGSRKLPDAQRLVTKGTLDSYPPELFDMARRLGIREIIVAGCESGQPDGLVQYASHKMPGITFSGSLLISGLRIVRLAETSDGWELEARFADEGAAVRYRDGKQLAD